MHETKRAAIIGFGGMGQRHRSAYKKIGVEVVAVADLFPEKIRPLLPEIPADRIYKDYHDLFRQEEIDIVSVVTNGPTHARISTEASEAGIRSIMCEKPMATRLADAERLAAACTKNGTRLAVNHIRRWSSNYRRLRDLIAAGTIGDLRHLYFSCGSTGLGNFAIHFFDTARFLTGSEPEWVSGFIDRTGTPNPRGKQYVDPGGYGIIRFRNGARFYVDTSEDTGVQYSFQLVGTYGRVIIDELNDSWSIRTRNPETRKLPLTRYGADTEAVPFASDAKFDIVDLTSKGLAELLSDAPVSSTGDDGIRSLEMVMGFHASEERGNVKVPFPLAGKDREREVPIA
ncbi:MAG TPA: Gfo/Idh/MocA family oxidoreductase [Methanoregula sp.]|nr:Gfo/Idh/MocA family oxidoreductase [Methanoregula sp.]